MKIECTHCGHVGDAPQEFAGKNVRCPKCKKLFAAGAGEFTLAEKPASVEGTTARAMATFALIAIAIALVAGSIFALFQDAARLR